MYKWLLITKIKTFKMARIVRALMRWAFYQLPSHFNWKQCLLIAQNSYFCNSASLQNYFFAPCGAKVEAPRVMFHTSFLAKKATLLPSQKNSGLEATALWRILLQQIFRELCAVSYFAESTGYKGSLLLMVSGHARSQARFEWLHHL